MSETEELLRKLIIVRTMPKLDALRDETARVMMAHDKTQFHTVQNAFRKAKNRLKRIPIKDRTW